MKTLIIYYSHSGNNAVLAEETAQRTGADLFRLEEQKERTVKTIILDSILHRRPSLRSLPEKVEEYDLVVFISPVWMFHLASPVQSCMKQLRKQIRRYALITQSGGALGPNTKLSRDAVRWLGKNMAFQMDLTAAQFGSLKKNISMQDTSGYKLIQFPEDLDHMANLVVLGLKGVTPRVS